VLKSIGNMAKAKEYYEKALVIVTEIGERRGEGVCYVRLGNAFKSLGECVMVEEYFNKALSISKDIGDGKTEFRCYCLLSLTKISQEMFEEAFSYLDQGENLLETAIS